MPCRVETLAHDGGLPLFEKEGGGIPPHGVTTALFVQIVSADPLLALFGHHLILGYSDGFIAFTVLANNTGCLHNLVL